MFFQLFSAGYTKNFSRILCDKIPGTVHTNSEPKERRLWTMADTKNPSIHCTVSQCAHHCMSENYCTLESINVGTHETNPTMVECTDCNSFRRK